MSSNDEVTNKQVEAELEKIKSGLTKSTANPSGVGLCGWMFLIFMTLKLTNVINWSWWWVTAPLWIPILMIIAILIFMLIMLSIAGSTIDSAIDSASGDNKAEVDEKKE